MSEKLDHALRLAKMGFYVFPVEKNGKLPVVPWRDASTTDPDTIKNWWIDPYLGWKQDYNIGLDCGKSGLLVLDIDRKPGKNGDESLKKLEAIEEFPDTIVVDTPSGGLHYYYRAAGYGNTQGDKGGIMPGIDTRGEGGYVVAPGSLIDGKPYTFHAPDKTIAAMPTWLAERLSAHKAVLAARNTGKELVVDHEDDIAWAIDFLKNHEPAIEGAGGDHHTFVTFCKLKEHGLSCQTAIDLADEHWNDKCSPPWTIEDLTLKANSAYKSAQNATGVKSAHAEFEPIIEPKKPSLLTPLARFELKSIPKRERVCGDLAYRKKVSAIVAPGGSGKSLLTLSLAISKATGRNLLNIDPHGRGRVAVYNNEDDMIEMQRRLGAILQHYKIPQEELFGEQPTLFLNSGENLPLRIAKRCGQANNIKPEHADWLVESLIDNNIDMFIVDPFAETHPAKENDNEEILHVGRIFRAVAQRANCAVVLVHHTRKLDSASSDGHSGNLDSMRGASSLGGLARVVVTFNNMNSKQAKAHGISEEDRKRYAVLEQAKANMSAPSSNLRWFEWHSERINAEDGDPDSGEDVGVLKPVKLTHKRETVSDAARQLIIDVESLVIAESRSIKDLAKELISTFPMHLGKQAPTVEKAIRRLFDTGIVTGFKGTMYLEERPGTGKAPSTYIRFEKNAETALAAVL